MSWRPDRPYDELPPIPRTEVLETRPVLRACIKARAELAGLKQAARLIPDQSMLISTLPLLEAQASSEIENIVTTADKLFERLGRIEGADPMTREALRYRHALMEGFQQLDERPLCTRAAEIICSTIKGRRMQVRKVLGTQLVSSDTGEVIYTPPAGETTIRNLLGDWERFMHERREVDPLIRLAAGHYQFEAIHPFTDGNGRTGRVINSLFLIQEDLLTLPILYLSRFIIQHKDDYYALLIDVTRAQSWEPWLVFMLQAVRETAAWTTDKISAIRVLSEATARHVQQRLPKIFSREIIDVIFARPYCRIANLVDAGIVKRQTAARYLHALVEVDVLTQKKVGRERLFMNHRLLRLLTRPGNTFEPFAASLDSHSL